MPQNADSCWECLRRKSICDRTRPICTTCHDAGLVCPGFGDQRPLTWLAPGKVTARPQPRRRKKAGTAGGKAGGDKVSEVSGGVDGDGPASTLTPAPALAVRTCKIRRAGRVTGSNSVASASGSTAESSDMSDQASRHGSGSGSRNGSPLIAEDIRLVDISHVSQWRKAFMLPTSHQEPVPSISKHLHIVEFDLLDAVEYYVNRIYLPAVPRQLAPSVFFVPVTMGEMLSQFTEPSRHHSFICVTLAHQIAAISQIQGFGLDPENPGAAAHLWVKFYHHIGLAIRALNEEIGREEGVLSGRVFLSILLLLGAEVTISTSMKSGAHISGFLAVIRLHGGLSKMMASPETPKPLLLSFVVSCTMGNTTSPSHNQVVEVSNLSADELYNLYSYSIFPPLICPPHLFMAIFRINKLRLKLATELATIATEDEACEAAQEDSLFAILSDVDGFLPEHWVKSSGLPHPEECLLVARIFQAAVALYALASLPLQQNDPVAPKNADVKLAEALKRKHHARLLQSLEPAMATICKETMIWPLVVAGVMAETGPERETVLRYMDKMSECLNFVPSMRVARLMLKRFWVSGKTGWDDCFDRQYGFV